jgi:hypothetical protein
VVCCRLSEYRWLPKRLKLNGAIRIEPLSSEEVRKYLAGGGSKLEALRGAIDVDPVLKDLAQTPLVLRIMSLAYQGVGGDKLVAPNRDSPEERRKQIFHLYVEQMFQRKGTAFLLFPKEKTIGGIFSGMFGGGMIGGMILGGMIGILVTPIIVATIIGMSALGLGSVSPITLKHITLAETIIWNWYEFWRKTIDTLIRHLIKIMLGGLIFGLLQGLSTGLISGLISWLSIGLSAALGVGLINGLLGRFSNRVKDGKTSPNEGIKSSLRNSLIIFLVTFIDL